MAIRILGGPSFTCYCTTVPVNGTVEKVVPTGPTIAWKLFEVAKSGRAALEEILLIAVESWAAYGTLDE